MKRVKKKEVKPVGMRVVLIDEGGMYGILGITYDKPLDVICLAAPGGTASFKLVRSTKMVHFFQYVGLNPHVVVEPAKV